MKENEVTPFEIKTNGKYTPEIRSFAMTLHFYSTKAYNYVRKKFNNKLPNPSTIRAWYRVVDGSPGFTTEALQAIKLRAEKKPVVINLVLDEMAIRDQLIYNEGRFHGGVDLGNEDDCGSNDDTHATNALVFMAVSLNGSWKVPIGYFLIRSLSGQDRANLLKLAFKELHEINCKVYSITFDGAASNISMCTHLGANLTYGPSFRPYFNNPCTGETCFIFYDLCHMIKLVRNTLGDFKELQTGNGEEIAWKYIEKLFELQREEGLRLANKLTKKHIYYQNSKMNVKLAMQTLSNSVYCSLLCLQQLDDADIQPIFEKSHGTATFCKNFNDMTDILNCKNRFAKGTMSIPLNDENRDKLKNAADMFERYINDLYTTDKNKILLTKRKTGFIGIIICLRNIFPLFEQLKKLGLTYLLTYKLSQDYIETFFSAIRSRGGFNNNPNALEFKSAYKRLLIRHELKEFENGNCVFDSIDILSISSTQNSINNPVGNCNELNFNFEADHDYNLPFWELSAFVENVVLYIAGFIAYKLSKNIVTCDICVLQLKGDIDKSTMPLLSQIKNRGPYIIPSSDLIDICKMCEQIIRKYQSELTKGNIKKILINKIFHQIGIKFDNITMNNHIMQQEFLDNHRTQLCKYIIELYLNTRLHYEAKKMSEKDVFVRQKYTKLILFKNQ